MPIEYRIDHDRKLVVAKGRGTVTDPDVFGYQREVWSRDDVAGYDELIDMSEVEHIAVQSVNRVCEFGIAFCHHGRGIARLQVSDHCPREPGIRVGANVRDLPGVGPAE